MPGKGKKRTLPGTLTIDPVSPDAGGEYYIVHGEGFEPGEGVHLSIHEPFCCAGTSMGADENGEFNMRRTTKTPGVYQITALRIVKKRGKDKIEETAFTTFVVGG